jgi:toxin YhaV
VNSKTIILAWVNNTDTKRTRGAKNDPYAIFQKRLQNGHPPNEWSDLLEEAIDPDMLASFEVFVRGK